MNKKSMMAFINNKPLYFNLVLILTSLVLIVTRKIPLSVILLVILMVEVDIIIALRLKNNIKKSRIYMMAFMMSVILIFFAAIYLNIDNETFKRIILFTP